MEAHRIFQGLNRGDLPPAAETRAVKVSYPQRSREAVAVSALHFILLRFGIHHAQ
jgi:hypothetical protein